LQGLLPRRPAEERLAADDRAQEDFRDYVKLQPGVDDIKLFFVVEGQNGLEQGVRYLIEKNLFGKSFQL
jgi:hypothetical protein